MREKDRKTEKQKDRKTDRLRQLNKPTIPEEREKMKKKDDSSRITFTYE